MIVIDTYDLFGYQVEIDTHLTKSWYDTADAWGCECAHCRNFLALASQKQLPAPILDMLYKLNIPPQKATYVCEIIPKDEGFLYEFSYRIAGNIISEPRQAEGTLYSWGEGRCCHEPYPYGAPGFPTPHFDLEFWVTLPWVLDDTIKE